MAWWFGFYDIFYYPIMSVDVAGGLLDYQRRNDWGQAAANQLQPQGLPVGKQIIPRARAHLPAGMRFREARPDGQAG